MGSGTDVAEDTASLILHRRLIDFASIVMGSRKGATHVTTSINHILSLNLGKPEVAGGFSCFMLAS